MAEPELRITREPRRDSERLAAAPARWYHEDDETIDLAPYVFALRDRWRTVAAAAVAAAVITALLTGLALPKWYRAKAVIRPIAPPAVEGRIAGVIGGLGGGFGLNGLAASLGTGGNNDAEEYIAILRGFGFNVALANRHQLAGELLKPWFWPVNLLFSWKDPEWGVYRALKKRFDCEYSIKTGNIKLYFQAKNRSRAEKILGYYVKDLRDLLRAREISLASAAIASLETEARTTPDAVLRTELYLLVAKQVQRKKMAQVEADFAFRVLDPPAASDKAYRPWVLLDSVLVAFFAFLSSAIWVIAKAVLKHT